MAKQAPSGGLSARDAVDAFVSREKVEALRAAQARLSRAPKRPVVGTAEHRTRHQAERAYKSAERAVLAEFGQRLRSGEIVAYGVLEPVSTLLQYQEIPAELWEILQIRDWKNSTVRGGGQVFHLVKFFDPAELVSRPGTAGAMDRCRKWLANLAEQGPKTKNKSDYREEAMQLFPGLSLRGFASAWTQAVGDNPNWTRPGRRSKPKT